MLNTIAYWKTKLKPCPLCGREIEHYTIDHRGRFATGLEIRCDKCHARFQINLPDIVVHMLMGNSECCPKDAVEIWNKRVVEDGANEDPV